MGSVSQKITQGLSDLKSFRVVHYKNVASTNDEAFRLAEDIDEELLLVIADSQTHGRGRQRKQWYSPPGNLYMSILIKSGLLEGLRLGEATQLITLAAGVAVVEAVHGLYGYLPSLKWPNDIMAGDRKIGGILTESRFHGRFPSLLVIGIGLNLIDMKTQGDMPDNATSLSEFVCMSISREDLCSAITRSLLRWLSRLSAREQGKLTEQWLKWSTTIGRKVEVIGDGWSVAGVAKTVDHLGRLIVAPLNSGVLEPMVINSGSLFYI